MHFDCDFCIHWLFVFDCRTEEAVTLIINLFGTSELVCNDKVILPLVLDLYRWGLSDPAVTVFARACGLPKSMPVIMLSVCVALDSNVATGRLCNHLNSF